MHSILTAMLTCAYRIILILKTIVIFFDRYILVYPNQASLPMWLVSATSELPQLKDDHVLKCMYVNGIGCMVYTLFGIELHSYIYKSLLF